MGKLKFLMIFAFVFTNCANTVGTISAELHGTVVKIVDGDTFDLLTKEHRTIRIRMNGIDCPEKKQDFYQVAKNALSTYIFKTEVQLITFGKDRYGRVVADVFTDGQNINLAMVMEGYAWHYKKYSSDTALANAENEAREAKRGLWQTANPIPPWKYRQ
jgi:micrococcal nuclease